MTNEKLKIEYKIFMEAEDVAQTRILSTEGYIKKSLASHKNPYICRAEVDNESDVDEFMLRLYVEEEIEEETCENADAAEGFLDELAELLVEFARMQSYLEMEGNFSISFAGEQISYRFLSEAGNCNCTFEEVRNSQIF